MIAIGHLDVVGLTVSTADRAIISGASLTIRAGSTLGIVGESGSGKSMLVKALSGLLPAGVSASGTVTLDGDAIDLAMPERSWRAIRGRRLAMIPQDPFTSLDPMRRCGVQIMASLADSHRGSSRDGDGGAPALFRRFGRRRRARQEARGELTQRLAEVGLPERVARQYPHELSGGMRQRVVIAAALTTEPEVLFADEPTTALDVTTQREILDLLLRLQRDRGMSLVLITHDLALAQERCDEILVMKTGEIVESGAAVDVFERAAHPYTRALRDSSPRIDARMPELPASIPPGGPLPFLTVRELSKRFPGSQHLAVSDVSLDVFAGECVGIVGESGSGKTTVARCIVGLETATAGRIDLHDTALSAPAESAPVTRTPTPKDIQIVYQDPYSALNPALTVGATLKEAAQRNEGNTRTVSDLLTMVGLPSHYARRRPARLSGGERQRVAIARALAVNPRILVCDESVSALDVSVQAQILVLLAELQRSLGLTVLFISHDLAVMRQIADRLYVMLDGEVVEEGTTEQILSHPAHPYTQALLASVPQRREAQP